jgi:hypothetical protein
MNHLSKKKRLYGAGKKPKVIPAVLSPPKIGDFQFGASFSYIETLDLISDGPIEGLVDPKGNLLKDNELSRGVYMDDTPVSIGIDGDDDLDSDLSAGNQKYVSKGIETFNNLNTQDSGGASIFQYIKANVGGYINRSTGSIIVQNLVSKNNAYILDRHSSGGTFVQLPGSINKYQDLTDIATDTTVGVSFPKLDFGYLDYQFLFTNGATAAASDFFIGFKNGYDPFNRPKAKDGFRYDGPKNYSFTFAGLFSFVFKEKFGKQQDEAEGSVQVFNQIKTAWNTYGPSGETNNPFMRNLIDQKMSKVFGSAWNGMTSEELSTFFFKAKGAAEYMAIYLPDREVLNGMSIEFSQDQARDICIIPTEEGGIYSEIIKKYDYADLLIPIFDKDGKLDAAKPILGASFMFITKSLTQEIQEIPIIRYLGDGEYSQTYRADGVKKEYDVLSLLKSLKRVTKITIGALQNATFNSQYNYNNVLIEARNGSESQKPFRFFNKVYIDKDVSKNLYGPFKITGEVQRLSLKDPSDAWFTKDNLLMDTASYNVGVTLSNNTPINEGSNDKLRGGGQISDGSKAFSSWNDANKEYTSEEKAGPVTYYVNNPNVSEVFITLKIDSLFDTVEINRGDEDNNFKIGDKMPAILNVEIEVGKVLSNGAHLSTSTRVYRIAALVESSTLLDIGNPANSDYDAVFKHVRNTNDVKKTRAEDMATPFQLPNISSYSRENSFSSPEKRYIKVTKLSAETFSILISKEVTLQKVTEIIPVNLTYPFSAIIGTKVDSKSFSSIPQRTFDARLKLVKIPTNYFPTEEGYRKVDKRYYDTTSEFNEAAEEKKSIYKGDWSGGFKMGWTDNPAWILYDLLTNTRYGLGRYVNPEDINKWELYKIGRFNDAVDANGNFEGVPDGRGGLEPRYSCNIIFKSDEKVFDSIQLISKLFRGQTFFRASEVSFTDERAKSPIAAFNNNNVKDGTFNYSNLRRDQQFNTVEVSYLDRFENFVPKVEVIEDEEDIRSRGVFKNKIDGLGVTSRAMARRIGQHLIYRTIKENQRVAFTSGLEALLCQPGDLIIIDDDLKNQKSNFGKVLSVDVDNQYIQLSGPYSESSMTGILTVYNPTGQSSISELDDVAVKKRVRTDTFTITPVVGFEDYTGVYNFSAYKEGYTEDDIEELDKFSEYASYTGAGDNIIYFHTGATGWVFATGLDESDIDYINKAYTHTLESLNTGFVSTYDPSPSSLDSRTLPDVNISGKFSGNLNIFNAGGILESEMAFNSQPQIVTLNVTGNVGTGDGFSFVSGVDSPDYLQFIKLGSPYRFDLKDADDILYKIDSIKENNPNEYLVSAAKFETGKFALIENNISLDRKENTYDYNVATQIGDITYTGLSAPENLTLDTGAGTETDTFYISGRWDEVTDKDSYEAVLRFPNGGTFLSTDLSDESIKFDNLSSIGHYSLSVKAVGSSIGSTKTIDSEFSTEKIFVLYQQLEEFNKSFINNITIIN